jgi:hypothetical protein
MLFDIDGLIYMLVWRLYCYVCTIGRLRTLICMYADTRLVFGLLEVEYMGHIVGKDGFKVDPKKIEAM